MKSDMFSVFVSRDTDQSAYKVNSVVIQHPMLQHRMVFTQQNDLGLVFKEKLSAYLAAKLDALDRPPTVLTEPEVALDFPGLVLGRLRIIANKTKDQITSYIIRFSYFVGGLQSAFRFQTHFSQPTLEHRESIAVSSLADICIPAFDLISGSLSAMESLGLTSKNVKNRVNNLNEIESDLLFYMYLLRRYVVSNKPAQLAPESVAMPDLAGLTMGRTVGDTV